MIAALFVDARGPYVGLPGVDPWPLRRDARLYAGPWPVVAHPPCARWCRLAKHVEHSELRRRAARPLLPGFDHGRSVGADGGTFGSALASVRAWGGGLRASRWIARMACVWPRKTVPRRMDPRERRMGLRGRPGGIWASRAEADVALLRRRDSTVGVELGTTDHLARGHDDQRQGACGRAAQPSGALAHPAPLPGRIARARRAVERS